MCIDGVNASMDVAKAYFQNYDKFYYYLKMCI